MSTSERVEFPEVCYLFHCTGDDMGKRTGLTIGKTRSVLYKSARVLGDINAVVRGTISQRIVSRGLGFLTGTLLGKIMRTIFGGRR